HGAAAEEHRCEQAHAREEGPGEGRRRGRWRRAGETGEEGGEKGCEEGREEGGQGSAQGGREERRAQGRLRTRHGRTDPPDQPRPGGLRRRELYQARRGRVLPRRGRLDAAGTRAPATVAGA